MVERIKDNKILWNKNFVSLKEAFFLAQRSQNSKGRKPAI